MLEKLSIIYNTCDKYESLWPGFFALWDKYWPECNNKIILNTEEKDFRFGSLNIQRPTNMDKTCSWSQRLLYSLENIETPYVLLVLDDFYIKSKVRLEVLEDCIRRMDADKNVQLFTFAWQPGPNVVEENADIFERRGRWARYKVNAQIGLWRVSYLKRIIRKTENPWQFELNGSFRSGVFGGKCYSLKKEAPLVFDYDWGFLIVRGKVNRKITSYFEKNEKLEFNLPFEDFDESQYCPSLRNKITRYLKYGLDMVTSLFRR